MLNTEQSILVATKVWGQKVDRKTCATNIISDMVNSWQGFGRTVEAMAEREYIFNVGFWVHKNYGIIFWDTGASTPQNLIKATHLAALEALK